jgi:glycosyltransferase involved in cell wall biosynthesis
MDVLLKAAAILCRQRPDVRFRIAGDGTLRASLEARAAALGLGSHVQFLGHVDDVAALLRRSGVFAFPSLMEASPNAVIEAMSAGLAVAASDVGGIPEVIEHGRNGVLVAPGDAAALAAAIGALIEDRESCERLGAAARATIQARFSFDRMVDAFHSLYVTELRRRRPRAVPAGTWARAGSATPAQRDCVPVLVDELESKMLQ